MMWRFRVAFEFICWCGRKLSSNWVGMLITPHNKFVGYLEEDPFPAALVGAVIGIMYSVLSMVVCMLTAAYQYGELAHGSLADAEFKRYFFDSLWVMPVYFFIIIPIHLAFRAFVREREDLIERLKQPYN